MIPFFIGTNGQGVTDIEIVDYIAKPPFATAARIKLVSLPFDLINGIHTKCGDIHTSLVINNFAVVAACVHVPFWLLVDFKN